MDTKFKMSSSKPAQKVVAATLGAAVATIVIWILNSYVLKSPLPEAVAGAVTVIVTTLVTFLAGYFTSPAAADQIVPATTPQPASH